LGLSHPLEVLIYTAEILKDKDIFFLFIGNGGKRPVLEEMVKEKNLKNVKFLPYQNKENLAYSLSSGDIAVVTMEPGIKGLSVPSKLYAYLAAGRPILGLVEKDSEVGIVVRKAQCGFIFDPEDIEEISRKIVYLIAHPEAVAMFSGNARKYFELNFNRRNSTKKYFNVLSLLWEGLYGRSN